MNHLERFKLLNYCEHIRDIIGVEYSLIDLVKIEEDLREYNCSGCTVDKALCKAYHCHGVKHSLQNFGNNLYECAGQRSFLALDFFAKSKPLACLLLGPFEVVKPSELPELPNGVTTLAKLAAIQEYVLDFTRLYNTSSYATPLFANDDNLTHDLNARWEEYRSYKVANEHLLEHTVASGSVEEAVSIANGLLQDAYLLGGHDLFELRSRASELLVIISRAAIDAGADIPDCFSRNSAYTKQIFKAGSKEEIIDLMTKAIPFYVGASDRLSNVRHPEIIAKVKSYITQHFSEKITISQVAAYCSVSTSYLSKILREDLGCSFTEYTNLLRIENSKVMLLGTDLRIAEIAAACGFDEQSYFTKVFKKVVGLNPCKFRDQRGETPAPAPVGQ